MREGASCVYQVNGGEGRSPDPISGKAPSVMWETLAGELVHTVVGKRGHIWWEASAREIGGKYSGLHPSGSSSRAGARGWTS